MSKIFRYMMPMILAAALMFGSEAFAISKTSKKSTPSIPKISDTTKPATPSKPAAPKQIVPATKDTSSNSKVGPQKHDDFKDENKNGVDDRLEKSKSSTIKKTPAKPESDSKDKPKSKSSSSSSSSSSSTKSKKSK